MSTMPERKKGWLQRELRASRRNVEALPKWLGGTGNRWAGFTDAELRVMNTRDPSDADWLILRCLIDDVAAEIERRKADA